MAFAAFLFSACKPKTESVPTTQLSAPSLYDAAWVDARRGDLKSASQQAELGLSQNQDPNAELHWAFLTLKAEILMRRGLSEEALGLLKQQLPAPLARSKSALWRELTLAAALGYLDRYRDAEFSVRNAQTLAEVSFPEMLGEVELRKGTLASLQWQFPVAKACFSKALDISRAIHDQFLEASALGSLGVLAARMGHFDESLDWNEQAIVLARTLDAKTLIAKIEGNSAWSYHELGDFIRAADQYDQAEKDSVQTDLRHEQVLWKTNSAVVHYELHDYAKAQTKAKEALSLALKIGEPADVIECFQNDALISTQNSRLDDARKDLQEAAAHGKQFPDMQRDLYTALLTANLEVRENHLTEAKPVYAYILRNVNAASYLLWEAHVGLAQIFAAEGSAKSAEREFEAAILTIEKARAEVGRDELRFAFLSRAIRFYDQYVNFLIAQKRPLDALKIADLSRAQMLESGLTVWKFDKNGQRALASTSKIASRQIHPQEIAAKFDATLLFYWLGEENSHLWMITSSNISIFPVPPRAELETAVASYRETILFDPRDPLESGNAAAKKLSESLVSPVANAIPKNSRIIILADGALNGLNFETLPIYEPQPHYWIEDVTISIANSLSLLSHAHTPSVPDPSKILFFGDPIPPAPDFPRLADAEEETRAVRQHFPDKQGTFYLREDAKPSAYLTSKLQNYSYLHFATHGTASITRPLESAIILSREGDSYKLYARDVIKHPMNAYLVSISACEGAGKRTFAGEGLIGLSWAFLRAGAHHVVAGLWEISTASTPQTMGELYKSLRQGKDPATALHAAKLSLLHSKIALYHRPLYWAPFQLYLGS